MVTRQGRARQPGFDAARPAAVARLSRQLRSARPGQRIVPPLARNAVDAFDERAIRGESASRARPENHAEHDSGAGGGAIGHLVCRLLLEKKKGLSEPPRLRTSQSLIRVPATSPPRPVPLPL